MVLDVLLVLWTAWWLGAGIAAAREVRDLADLGQTAGRVGRAVTGVGQAIGGLPVIGGQLREPAQAVEQAGQDAVASAESARSSARRAGVLLGIAIAAIPTVPLLVLWIPGRMGDLAERRALTRALRETRPEQLDDLLARRALVHLPYRILRRVSADPAADVAAGRHRALADAELAWFGVRRPRRR
jgi:hypothetical protein